MPRQPRSDAPGCVHHVLVRGIEKREIFRDDRDRRDFLDRLEVVVAEGDATCLAWALMPNHVHLVLRTGTVRLPRLMARLNSGYATAFNLRHDRVGHLFQNRYKSLLVEDDAYLQTLVRYVHLNPIRSGLVTSLRDLADYPWTGHAALMGRAPRRFLAVESVLDWFGEPSPAARGALVHWMRAGLAGGDGDEVPEPADRCEDATPHPERPDLDRLIARVCRELGVREERVRLGRRAAAEIRARDAIAHLATDGLGIPQARLAPALGITPGSVSRACRRGQRVVRDARLRLEPPGGAGATQERPLVQERKNVP